MASRAPSPSIATEVCCLQEATAGYSPRQIAAALDAYRDLCEVISAGGSAAQFWRWALYELHFAPDYGRSRPGFPREPSFWSLAILRADLDMAIDSLPAPLRRVAHWYWRCGCEQMAIAWKLRVTTRTVRNRLSRARRLIIEKLLSSGEAKCHH